MAGEVGAGVCPIFLLTKIGICVMIRLGVGSQFSTEEVSTLKIFRRERLSIAIRSHYHY